MSSWSRVPGVGIPASTAIEIMCIWVLSILLAVPEAVGFNMVGFDHNNITAKTCMLKPESKFMEVSISSLGTVKKKEEKNKMINRVNKTEGESKVEKNTWLGN